MVAGRMMGQNERCGGGESQKEMEAGRKRGAELHSDFSSPPVSKSERWIRSR